MRRNKDLLRYGGVLIFNLLFMWIILHSFGFCFEENDDVVMCMIANGMYTGSPDCHLVFINALYGSILVGLYSLIPTVEWYTWSFLFLHICAMTIIVTSTIHIWRKNIPLSLTFILLFYVIWATWLQMLQFTTTAAICTMAGCVLLQCKRHSIIAALFVLIGSLIRFEAAALVALIFLPLFIYTYRRTWSQYAILCGIGVLCLFTQGADTLFYQTPEWKYYKEWNAVRGSLNDNPNLYLLQETDIDENISQEDVQLLMSFCADPAIWSMERLYKAYEIVHQDTFAERLLQIERWKPYTKYLSVLGLLLLLICCSFLTQYRWVICVMNIWFIVVIACVGCIGTIKDRVFVSAVFSLCVCMLLIFNCLMRGGGKRQCLFAFCVSIPLLLLSAKYTKRLFKRVDGIEVRKECLMNEQYVLVQDLPASWKVVPLSMKIEGVNPLHVLDIKADYYMNGWMTNFALKGYNSFEELVDNPIGIIISKANNTFVTELLKSTIERNYDRNIQANIVCANKEYMIINFQTIPQ